MCDSFDKKIPDVMVVRVPSFRAVTSGLEPWDVVFGAFDKWMTANQQLVTPAVFDCPDFLTGEGDKCKWYWRVKDGVTEADTAPYKIVDFPGGLYAVAVCIDGDDESHNKVRTKMDAWLTTTNFAEDTSRRKAGHMIYVDEEIRKGLGYHQLNLYLPIKLETGL